jgi:hypothetical protein
MLEHLLQNIFIFFGPKIDAVLAVHETVGVEILPDVQCLCNLLVTPNYVVEAVAIFLHDSKDSLLLCVRGCPVHLQLTFFDCFEDLSVLVLCHCFCADVYIPNLEFFSFLDLLDNFFYVLIL